MTNSHDGLLLPRVAWLNCSMYIAASQMSYKLVLFLHRVGDRAACCRIDVSSLSVHSLHRVQERRCEHVVYYYDDYSGNNDNTDNNDDNNNNAANNERRRQ